MPAFRVEGVDQETGMDTAITIEAASEEAAKIKAEMQGMLVARVVVPRGGRNPSPARPPHAVCRLCGSDRLKATKVARLGTAGVVLSWIIGLPAILSLVISILVLLGVGSASTAVHQDARERVRVQLIEAGLDQALAVAVSEGRTVRTDTMSPEHRQAVSRAQASLAGSTVGTGLAATIFGGSALCGSVSSLMLLCLAALFGLRKKVIVCGYCKAAVDSV